MGDEETPAEAMPPQSVVVVPSQLMQEVLDKLQEELPMRSVRTIVQQLEACPLMRVNVTDDAEPNSDSD